MTTRDPYFFSARAVATSARLNNGPKGWIGKAVNTGVSTSQITTASDVTISGTSVSPFVHSNRSLKITGTATLTCGTAATKVALVVVQGGTEVGRIGRADMASGEVRQFSGTVFTDNGTAGTTEFHLQVSYISSSGSGTIDVANTSTAAARILVEDMGASA